MIEQPNEAAAKTATELREAIKGFVVPMTPEAASNYAQEFVESIKDLDIPASITDNKGWLRDLFEIATQPEFWKIKGALPSPSSKVISAISKTQQKWGISWLDMQVVLAVAEEIYQT